VRWSITNQEPTSTFWYGMVALMSFFLLFLPHLSIYLYLFLLLVPRLFCLYHGIHGIYIDTDNMGNGCRCGKKCVFSSFPSRLLPSFSSMHRSCFLPITVLSCLGLIKRHFFDDLLNRF